MLEVKVDKGVPLPKAYKPRHSYPWREMQVGDSFELASPPASIATQVWKQNRANGKTFAMHKRGAQKVRIWRVK